MNFLTPIYEQLNTEIDVSENTSTKKATFYSLINYIVANDDPSNSGIKKKDIEERFALRKDYSSILSMLVEQEVVEELETSVRLNHEAKLFISPLLQNVLNYSYKNKFNNCAESDEDCLDNPHIKMLLECRANVFGHGISS